MGDSEGAESCFSVLTADDAAVFYSVMMLLHPLFSFENIIGVFIDFPIRILSAIKIWIGDRLLAVSFAAISCSVGILAKSRSVSQEFLVFRNLRIQYLIVETGI